ncbi:hypothetical protein Z945_1604 [Sulfitobacter noctilucae]|uniref:hypothetical protein n=1 Tax=Sulfitobacter noctilucae TaxID=1342302 RepID=UPI0004690236|nr:hypothetical protein [Sulfitobacter noctilucae]KIN60629.1 hypothetical protein Z945_1604 [Sulfitobacter noctilucae]
MAVSTTTFEERLSRINNGQTVDAAAKVGRTKNRRSFRARMLTFPCLVGVGILTGGAAYAFASVQPEMQWVMALAG